MNRSSSCCLRVSIWRAPHIGRRRGDSEQIRNTLPVPGVFRKMGGGPYDAPRRTAPVDRVGIGVFVESRDPARVECVEPFGEGLAVERAVAALGDEVTEHAREIVRG